MREKERDWEKGNITHGREKKRRVRRRKADKKERKREGEREKEKKRARRNERAEDRWFAYACSARTCVHTRAEF